MSQTTVMLDAPWESLPAHLRPAFNLRTAFSDDNDCTLSDEHAASSHGLPVLIWRGEALGAGDLSPEATITAYRHSDADLLARATAAGFTVRQYHPDPE